MLEVMMVSDGGLLGSLRFDAARVRRFTTVEPRVISIHERLLPERRRVEAHIETTYAAVFDGVIRGHYPTLMSVQDAHGEIHAAVGFRLARQSRLFLEQYLDEPVEAAIGRVSGQAQDRGCIAEIGNLASRSPGASLFLFMALALHLQSLACGFAVAAATKPLRRSFARLGLQTVRLAAADPSRLDGEAADWGRYYDRDPEVLAGAIAPALGPMRRLLLADPPAIDEPRPRLHPCVDNPEAHL